MGLRFDLFFKDVPEKPLGGKNGIYKYETSEKDFEFEEVYSLQKTIKFLVSQKKVRALEIKINAERFADSSTIILFELCLYYLHLQKPKVKISIKMPNLRRTIINDVFFGTHFNLTKNGNFDNFLDFKLDVKFEYFIKMQDSKGSNYEGSELGTELSTFLRSIGETDEDVKDRLIEIIEELAENACEHSKEDILVFLRRAPAMNKDDKTVHLYLINLICFSEDKIFTKLSKDFYAEPPICDPRIIDAYSYHSPKFDEMYHENHFFMLSALQPGITTREIKHSGGVGLTSFIDNINNHLDSVQGVCYVVCGKQALFFENSNLGIKREVATVSQIGLNKMCDYTFNIPDSEVLGNSPLPFNGILYNIVLVKECK